MCFVASVQSLNVAIKGNGIVEGFAASEIANEIMTAEKKAV